MGEGGDEPKPCKSLGVEAVKMEMVTEGDPLTIRILQLFSNCQIGIPLHRLGGFPPITHTLPIQGPPAPLPYRMPWATSECARTSKPSSKGATHRLSLERQPLGPTGTLHLEAWLLSPALP